MGLLQTGAAERRGGGWVERGCSQLPSVSVHSSAGAEVDIVAPWFDSDV